MRAEILNPSSDIGMDNEIEKAALELENENLDLVIEIDDWLASPDLSLSHYKG